MAKLDKPKIKPLRIFGEIPEGYEGPIYYRTMEDYDRPMGKPVFRYDKESLKRLDDAYGRGLRRDAVKNVVDENRNFKPDWQRPLTGKIMTDDPLRYEYCPDPSYNCNWMSERVHDAIESLEPSKHVFVPIDATRPDGRIERMFQMFWSEDDFFFTNPPILNLEWNNLERVDYKDSNQFGYHKPDWTLGTQNYLYHFGYLDKKIVRGKHLFATSLLNNQTVFSQDLVNKFAEFGDIFIKPIELCRMGAV